MLEHLAEARVYVTGLISLTVPQTRREIVMRVIIISRCHLGRGSSRSRPDKRYMENCSSHILPLDHRSLLVPFFLYSSVARSYIREA